MTATEQRHSMRPVEGNAFDLAVSYHAFMQLAEKNENGWSRLDAGGIVTWGNILIRCQDFFGLEVHPRALIHSAMDRAKVKMGEMPPAPSFEGEVF